MTTEVQEQIAGTETTQEDIRREAPGSKGQIVSLGRYSQDTVFSLDGLCTILGHSEDSIRRAEERGDLPHGFKWMGSRCWRAGDIIEHVAGLARRARQEAETEAKSHADKIRKLHMA
jgi:hypothetical protein